MNSLRLFVRKDFSIPASTSWLLADLGEFRGKQELFMQQSPQRLKTLREHALIESAVSSNRIEGVSVDQERLHNVLFAPRPLFRDRDEEEVRGYQDALTLIHADASNMNISGMVITDFHRRARGQIWDAGQYKEKDADIIERYANGVERVRFRPVSAASTPSAMAALIADWQLCLDDRWVHPLIAMAAFNLDFLCIHPFRDGNGRVSRLVLLLQCYKLGYQVGRYISLERLIEENKDRYYETLEQSSQGWHEGKHDPWPYINYIFFILKLAYRELTERVGEIKAPRGSKTDLVLDAMNRLVGNFTVAQVEQACPGVSKDMVRLVMREQQKAGLIECHGHGPAAFWRKRQTERKSPLPPFSKGMDS